MLNEDVRVSLFEKLRPVSEATLTTKMGSPAGFLLQQRSSIEKIHKKDSILRLFIIQW